ncbi:MAG: DsrE family protein [Pseudohongiellaceae bacterium]
MTPSGHIVFISSRAPWSSGAPLACLEALMTTAVFDVPACFVLVGDGVFQLLPDQDGTALGSRNLSKMIGALGLYGIDTIHVDADALAQFGLALDMLLPDVECESPLRLVAIDAPALQQLLAGSKAVLGF